MRISTSTLFQNSVASMLDKQSSTIQLQNQISSGKRIGTPSDDPVAAAQAVQVTQAANVNDQYTTNRKTMNTSLGQLDSTLGSVTDLLQSVKSTIVQAGNGSLDSSQRSLLATQLQGQLTDLIGLANSQDSSGNYLFSGFQSTTQPYTASPQGATYAGDTGQRLIQVSDSRQMPLSLDGASVFGSVPTGNGTFVTASAATNSGTGIISPGTVVNPAALTNHNYQITFATAGTATTYTVVDNSTVPPSNPVPANSPYTPGGSISFDGLSFSVTGAPAANDSFSISPSTTQSVFQVLSNAINTLKAPMAAGNVGANALASGLSAANQGLDASLTAVLQSRTIVGTRMQEVASLDSAGASLNIQYQSTLSNLQDLDYTKAISQLSQDQLALTASQKTFVQVEGLSLFNVIQ